MLRNKLSLFFPKHLLINDHETNADVKKYNAQ